MSPPQLRQRSVLSSDDLEAQLKHLEERTAHEPGPQVSMNALLELEGLEQLLDWASPQPEVRVRIRQTRTLYEQALWDQYYALWQKMMEGQPVPPGQPAPERVAMPVKPITPPSPPARPPFTPAPPVQIVSPIQGSERWVSQLPKIGSLSEFARITSLSASMLRDCVKAGMPAPKTKKGKYKLHRDPVIAWLKKNGKIF